MDHDRALSTTPSSEVVLGTRLVTKTPMMKEKVNRIRMKKPAHVPLHPAFRVHVFLCLSPMPPHGLEAGEAEV